MATVLLTWQLGEGLGHMLGLFPFAQHIAGNTLHRVYVALRDLSRAAVVFGGLGVDFLQAPTKIDGRFYFSKGGHYAQLLGNTGFGRNEELFALGSAWRNLFLLTRPDLIICDHSPIALLASRRLIAPDGRRVRRIVLGNGFTTPPDVAPMPHTRPLRRQVIEGAQVIADEQSVLRHVNWLLKKWKQPPLARLANLYGEADETFITNFPELDPYPERAPQYSRLNTQDSPLRPPYYGPTNDSSGGEPPQWSDVAGPKVFAYLKCFPRLTELLQSLNDRRLSILIYPDAIPLRIKTQFQSDTLRFADKRLDPTTAAGASDFAVLNATPGTTCDMLLAGKPILQIPIYGEQRLLAEACERLGVSQTIWPQTATRQQIDDTLDHFLANLPAHTHAAQSFAAKYKEFDPEAQRQKMLARTLELLESPAPAKPEIPPEFALHYP